LFFIATSDDFLQKGENFFVIEITVVVSIVVPKDCLGCLTGLKKLSVFALPVHMENKHNYSTDLVNTSNNRSVIDQFVLLVLSLNLG